MNVAQIVHLLRTKTAIGNTASTFEIPSPLAVTVKLAVDNGADELQKVDVPFSFASPISYLPAKSVLTLQAVKKAREEVEVYWFSLNWKIAAFELATKG